MEVLPQASQNDKSSQQNRDSRYNKKNLSEFRNPSDYYKGDGPRPQSSKVKKRDVIFRQDERYFKKKPDQPSAFQIDLDFEDYAHLMNDDLDEISKLQVTYKILKQQLREHQKLLIKKIEKKKKDAQEKRKKKPNQSLS